VWGSGRDDVELGVTSEVHRAKVVGGAVDGSKECGEELAEEGGWGGQTKRGTGEGHGNERRR